MNNIRTIFMRIRAERLIFIQHGVFSYYMLEGLKGRADQDGDGIITVSELFSYISRKVPQASAQDQHPVKKGETEGELVIGRTK